MRIQTTFQENKPTLYLVATPIGNLSDMSARAIEILNRVHTVFAEDTRTSGVLLKHHAIKTKLVSFHEHNASSREADVLATLREGHDVALISDAGTPLISDPGETLVQNVRAAGFNISAIPGPTALISALIASDLPTSPFTFIGFLPNKKITRETLLKNLAPLPHTLIIYESPHRVHKTLDILYELLGDRKICLARELTKRYETFIHFTLENRNDLPDIKGEIVLLIEGAPLQKTLTPHDMIEHVDLLIEDGQHEMDAIKTVAKLRKLKKNTVYMAYKTRKKPPKPDNQE